MDRDALTPKRKSWPTNITFVGIGMMIGGGVVIDGPPDTGLLVAGIFVALIGIGCRLIAGQ